MSNPQPDSLPGRPAVPRSVAFNGLIRAHAAAALVMIGYTVLLGLVMALKFSLPDFMGSSPFHTWGRLRYAHTQGVFFGWLGNVFLLFCYYAVPRLAERPVTSRALGWLLFVLWNFALVLPGWALVQAGFSQPLEWGEFPLAIDGVAVVCFLLTAVQFVLPFLRGRLADMYVSGWYIVGGVIFTLLAYPVGNLVPEFIPGARGATYSGLWIHDAIGLYVTPLALAIAYIVIPAETGRPIFSHFLSMIGFWLLFLVYPLNGIHHYVFSSIPMEAQQGAIVASVYLGVDVILVTANLLLSLRGCGGEVARRTPLRFVWMGVVVYLVVSLQGSLQALMPVNRFIHFSDWVIGHAHLAMIGFASFTAIGGLLHVWQRLPGARYNDSAGNWAFWLLTVGMTMMVLDLTAAGLVQGQLWESDAAWMESVRGSGVFWLVRTLSGIPILLAFGALVLSVCTGPVRMAQAAATPPEPVGETEAIVHVPGLAWLRKAYVVTAVAGVGFFVLSFVVLAVWPNQVLEQQIAASRPKNLPELSSSELHGRQIYIREGCSNCHSQLTRQTEADVRRFGVPSQAWESERDLPQMWGTRRIGPDLARERGRKARDWHLVHLWQPRHVVPDSIMPRYPWLFTDSAREPTQEALDLVAYLESLGRDAQLAGLTGPQPLPGLNPQEEKLRGMFCDCAIPRTAGTAPLLSVTGLEASERARHARRGSEVFAHNCAGCHGAEGRGDGPAAEALLPRPRDLTTALFSDRAVSQALWSGRQGSSMPGWHDLTLTELRGLAAHLQGLANADAGEPAPPMVILSERLRAQELYEANCQNCHGARGEGYTPTTTSLAPAPTSFRLVRPGLAHAEAVLTEGVPGTAMTSWRDRIKDEEDRRLLIRYVRTFYAPEP
jgi:cytochrome c oxidase cbb3-type subunit I/II